MHQTTYSKGQLIIEEGSVGDCAFIIDKGTVEIFVLRNGEKIVLGILSDGDIFGEMALINGDLRSANAQALAPTSVSVINRIFFKEKLTQSDPIISLLFKVMLERFHEARSKLLSMPLDHLEAMESTQRRDKPEDGQRRDTLERFRFINDLQAALADGQLQLVYQPIIELATGHLAGFEALVRWNHPVQGNISPEEFIRIAEDTQDIIPIGYWVFETACTDLRKIREFLGIGDGSYCPWMSINLSPAQFNDKNLGGHFSEILNRTGVPTSSIKIELTESVLIANPQSTTLFLREMKRLGLDVAVDDFGTGYSSLSYLHFFPVDVLKIDRSFVVNMLNDFRSREIINAIATLSKNLKIDIIAEGVDNHEAEKLLSQLGCRYSQGYLYSKPLPFEQAIAFLGSRPVSACAKHQASSS